MEEKKGFNENHETTLTYVEDLIGYIVSEQDGLLVKKEVTRVCGIVKKSIDKKNKRWKQNVLNRFKNRIHM